MSSVELRHVSKSFGHLTVIDDVSLTVESGEFVVFVGQSGCGKSTLLRMIAGLEPVVTGDIAIGGTIVNHLSPAQRSIAMVFQSYALYPQMTAAENIGFGLRVARLASEKIRERTASVAETLRLGALLQRRPRALSGGQRQRVAIGRAIARQPKVFLFDEPLSNLDAALRGEMRVEIARLHAQMGITSIYVTHDQIEAMTLADRIVVLDAGRIQQIGTPIEIFESPTNRFVAGFIGTPKMNFFQGEVRQDPAGRPVVRLACGTELQLGPHVPVMDGPLTLGVRPHQLAAGSEGPGAIGGTVSVVERLGAETLAYLETPAGERFTVRFDSNRHVWPAETLWLRPHSGALHLFDANGVAIGTTVPARNTLALDQGNPSRRTT